MTEANGFLIPVSQVRVLSGALNFIPLTYLNIQPENRLLVIDKDRGKFYSLGICQSSNKNFNQGGKLWKVSTRLLNL